MILTDAFGLFLNDEIVQDIQIRCFSPDVDFVNLKKRIANFDEDCSFQIINGVLIGEKHNNDRVFNMYAGGHFLGLFLQFLYLRQSIFIMPSLVPFFFTILHMARLDGAFVFLNTSQIKFEELLIFCLQYLIERKYTSDKISQFSPTIYNQLLKDGIDDMDATHKWMSVHDRLNDLHHDEFNNTGELLLNFYRDKAFYDKGPFKFGMEGKELPAKENELLKLHFFKAFSHLTRSLNITEHLWASFKEYQTNEFYRFGKLINFVKRQSK